ncbi:UDP-glucose:glycoprotein glucosyltransferase 1-like [Diadema antillarum]|uniref:UDP-glucose:glycoprotein glucosyltransferase 1-like n=1 Tax=Diadema antillarum TaxID=105358 RepID=UPI003A8627B6
MALWTRLLPLVALLCLHPLATEGLKSKVITTTLESKWTRHSIAMEASEFIAEKSGADFWQFLQQVANYQDEAKHDEWWYHFTIKIASRLLSPMEVDLLKWALSIHAFAPKIEMHHQIARSLPAPSNCDVFIDVHGQISCSLSELDQLIAGVGDRPKSSIYSADHQYKRSGNSSVVVILYGDLTNQRSNLRDFHKTLSQKAEEGSIQYVYRHFQQVPSDTQVRLSGYGVELAIKSTEYKAVDDSEVRDGKEQAESDADQGPDEIQGFIFSTLKERHPDLSSELNQFRQHLTDNINKMVPLKVWQLQDIAFQAAQRVLSSSSQDALHVLREVSQNFPMLARSLTKTPVRSEVQKEIKDNQKIFAMSHNVDQGDAMVMINGLVIDTELADPFMLLDLLKAEGRLLEGLHQLGIQGDSLAHVMKTKIESLQDSYAVDIRDNAVIYINDLESDHRYRSWPSSVQEFLRPTFPGMLRHIAKNVFHITLILDPTSPDSAILLDQAEMLYLSDAPLRFGFVFVVNDEDNVDGAEDAGVAMVRAFNFALMEDDGTKAMDLITRIHQEADEVIQPEDVISVFNKVYPGEDIPTILGPDSDYDDHRQDGKAYLQKTALREIPRVLINGVPLSKDELDPDMFEEAVVTNILVNTGEFQRAVYRNKVSDHSDLLEYAMTRPNVMPRLNLKILKSDNDIIDLSPVSASYTLETAPEEHQLMSNHMGGLLAGSMRYLTKKDDEAVRPVSMWVVTDPETAEGRQFLRDAVQFVKSSNNVRVGFVHNPASTTGDAANLWLPRAMHAAMETQTRNFAKNFIFKLIKEENYKSIVDGSKTPKEFHVNGMDMDAFSQAYQKSFAPILANQQAFARDTLGLNPGARALVANGRVYGPFSPGELFEMADFELIEKLISSNSATNVKNKLQSSQVKVAKGEKKDSTSDLVMRTDALLASSSQSDARKDTQYWKKQHSMISVAPRKPDEPSYDIVAVLDPLTRESQKWSHLLLMLSEALNVNINVFMNPKAQLSELPLKSFYRYVLEPELAFRVDSSLTAGPSAKFSDMPADTLLTMNVLTPESWLVESVRTPYDLDNIKLSEVSGSIHAEYELEYLLLEGHCFEQNTGQPPRGLQFTLGTAANPVMVDTIVMANLGYLQLKANPGAWMLRLRQGRSADIYEVASHEGTDSTEGSDEVQVVMDSFKAKIVRLKVKKKPDMQHEDLLSSDSGKNGQNGGGSGGIWDSISSSISGLTGSGKTKEGADAGGDRDSQINIFSLASGHLYERLLRIMMLSVLKHTKSPVKFWFLKNYLSPTFKESIPHMAKEYNFEYELVQYKWPRWLHQQTEKQRVIWGYKILFLDVLFPLNIKKIIFVDADQIVRADMQELADFDLKGAPYGYVPFCDSRREMDGFRFWKSGYWANHLAGRKYHISALYVVDLVKFRKIAAGDRLRGQYQALSQDPNSLANLDQDLPNNMIHQVAIRSLPQEWLYCETWCHESERPRAKTIDLCNNPLTKEPKLKAAVRIAPEWVDYDNEIKNLLERIANDTSEDETSENIKDEHTEL